MCSFAAAGEKHLQKLISLYSSSCSSRMNTEERGNFSDWLKLKTKLNSRQLKSGGVNHTLKNLPDLTKTTKLAAERRQEPLFSSLTLSGPTNRRFIIACSPVQKLKKKKKRAWNSPPGLAEVKQVVLVRIAVTFWLHWPTFLHHIMQYDIPKWILWCQTGAPSLMLF